MYTCTGGGTRGRFSTPQIIILACKLFFLIRFVAEGCSRVYIRPLGEVLAAAPQRPASGFGPAGGLAQWLWAGAGPGRRPGRGPAQKLGRPRPSFPGGVGRLYQARRLYDARGFF